MTTLDLEAEWARILDCCPPDLCALAKATGAVQRWRNVRSGADLLRLALSYAVGDLSLRMTAAAATLSDVPLADTSVLDRLRAAPPFLSAVLAHLLAPGGRGTPQTPGLRIRDATMISVPGSTGSDWRIHADFDPVTLRLRAVELTDHTGGERLARWAFARGDIVLGDRVFGTAQGLHHLDDGGAHGLLRTHLDNLGPITAARTSLAPRQLARRARRGDHETAIAVPDPNGGPPLRARLLVAPLPPAAARRARLRCLREAAKKKRTVRPRTLVLAGLLVVVTTVPAAVLSARAALDLYTVRYQVELFFKRAKSLLDLDALRADDPALVRAYLLAKLIAIALTEHRVGVLQGFSPCATRRDRVQTPSLWRLTQWAHRTLSLAILAPLLTVSPTPSPSPSGASAKVGDSDRRFRRASTRKRADPVRRNLAPMPVPGRSFLRRAAALPTPRRRLRAAAPPTPRRRAADSAPSRRCANALPATRWTALTGTGGRAGVARPAGGRGRAGRPRQLSGKALPGDRSAHAPRWSSSPASEVSTLPRGCPATKSVS